MTRYLYSDSVNPNPTALPGTYTGQSSTSATRPNIELVFQSLVAPNCAVSHAPAASATDVVRNVTLSWAEGAGGPSSYDVYFGNSPSPALATNQSGTTYDPGLLAANSTYYWKVVPKNVNGQATGCIERSFTTGSGFIYCGVSVTTSGDYTSAFSTTLANSNISYTATSNAPGSYSDQTSQNFQVAQGTSFDFSHTYVGGVNRFKIG